MSNWLQGTRKFRRLIADFRPSVVYADIMNNFTLASINQHIPTVIRLRGMFGQSMNGQRAYALHCFNALLWLIDLEFIKVSSPDYCCLVSQSLLGSYCPGLNFRTNRPKCLQAIWPIRIGYGQVPHKLKHPCVGILQKATILGKVREMEVLRDVIPKFPT